MRRKLSIVLVLVAVAVALWCVRQTRRSQAQVAELTGTVTKLERDVALQSQLRLPPRGAWSPPSDHVAGGTGDEPRSAGAGEDRQKTDRPRPPALSFDESRDAVAAAYSREGVDSDWSGTASRDLDSLLRGNLPRGSRLESVDCRATMCQVTLAHPDAETHGSWLLEGLREWPGAALVASEEQRDDEYVVTLYLAREGTDLPLGPR